MHLCTGTIRFYRAQKMCVTAGKIRSLLTIHPISFVSVQLAPGLARFDRVFPLLDAVEDGSHRGRRGMAQAGVTGDLTTDPFALIA